MKNSTPIFRGIATALITPLTAAGLDYAEFGRLSDWQIDQGDNALVICGTTGESSTLSDAEHRRAIAFACERVNGRVPVIAGTGSNETAYAVELTKSACADGADAVLVVTPYYNKTTQNGLVAMYNTIADASTKPVILYNVPSRTGIGIQPETYVKLAQHPNIAAIKEANSDISKIVETFALVGDQLDIYSGNDDQIVPILSMGGQGCISVLSNVVPKETVAITDQFFAGNVAEAARLQCQFMPLIRSLFCESNPIPVKAAMSALGFCENYLRLPLVPMEQDHYETMLQRMRELGLQVGERTARPLNIIVNGALGRMGQEVCRLVQEEGPTLAARVDRSGTDGCYAHLADYTGPADVVIDFSNHACAGELMAYCVGRNLPLVAATTGYTEEEFQAIRAGAEKVPVFQSYNMSFGVALLVRLVGQAAAIFGGCAVESVEAHHNRMADAPSGTALLLADAVKAQRPDAEYVFGRHGQHKRQPNEIGIHSLRMGNVVGEHEVIFSTDSQTITLKHQAHDRALFAEGALTAAAFLVGKPAGLYHMDDLLG